MKKIKSKLLLLLVCAFVFSLGLMGTFSLAFANEDISLNGGELQNTYKLEQTVAIPEASLTVSGETKKAKTLIFTPSGQAFKGSSVKLTEVGEYTVRFYETFAGKERNVDKTFLSQKSSFSVTNQSSTAVYDKELKGVNTTLVGGGAVEYNKIIDVSENTEKDALVSFYINPSVVGEQDFEIVIIQLTDADDPNNIVYIRVYTSDLFGTQYEYPKYTSYVSANYNNKNSFIGQEGSKTIHRGNRYGRPVKCSFSGQAEDQKTPIQDQVSLYFDNVTKKLKCFGSASPTYGGLVVDFDDTLFFKEPWKGFKNGRCYLSLYAEAYKKTAANIIITNINGEKITDEVIVDTKKPEITLDLGEYTEKTVPYGIVGKAYPLMTATAYDEWSVKELTTKVYYNYYSNQKAIIDSVGGLFTPKKEGIYTIEYKAVDTSMNAEIKTINVKIIKSSEQVATLITAEQIATAFAGIQLIMPTAEVTSDPRFGSTVVDITASLNGKSEVIEGGKFTPKQIGKWEISYKAVNYIGQETIFKYDMQVKDMGQPIFETTLDDILLDYYTSGHEYILPEVSAYNYSSGSAELSDVIIKVTYNGVVTTLNNRKFTPNVTNNGDTIKVDYIAGETAISKTITIVKVMEESKLKLSNLFETSDKVSVFADKKFISFSTPNDATIKYKHPAYIYDFSAKFNIDKLKHNFSKLTVVMTDSITPSTKIEIEINRGNQKKTQIIINKGNVYTLAEDYFVTGKPIDLSYDGKMIEINGVSYKVYDENGNAFSGFTSSAAFVEWKLLEVTGEAKIQISKLNGQTISSLTADWISPSIHLPRQPDIIGKLNSVIELSEARAYDVICGEVNVYISVRNDNDEFVTSTDGVVLDNVLANRAYQVAAKEYGRYYISYYAVDDFKNDFSIPQVVNILDREPPTITLENEVPKKAKINKTITLPTASVADNIDSDLPIYVMSISPKNVFLILTNGEFTPTETGVWTIRYFAYDSVGNLGIAEYNIEVGE